MTSSFQPTIIAVPSCQESYFFSQSVDEVMGKLRELMPAVLADFHSMK